MGEPDESESSETEVSVALYVPKSADNLRYLTATGSATANSLIADYVSVGGLNRADDGAAIGKAVEKLSSLKKNELRRRIELTRKLPSGYGVPPNADPFDCLAIVTSIIEDEEKKERQEGDRTQAKVALRVAWVGAVGAWGAAVLGIIAGLLWG